MPALTQSRSSAIVNINKGVSVRGIPVEAPLFFCFSVHSANSLTVIAIIAHYFGCTSPLRNIGISRAAASLRLPAFLRMNQSYSRPRSIMA